MPKTICNRPMVFYRTTAGRPVALANACWHRLVPLSMGRLRGDDEVQCGTTFLAENYVGLPLT